MRMIPRLRHLCIALALLVSGTTLSATGQEKKALDHDAYDIWNRITASAISNDGNWVRWTLGPVEKDATLRIRERVGSRFYEYARGENALFSADSRFAAFKIVAAKDSVRQAKLDKKKSEDMPKAGLGILDLSSGGFDQIERVMSFKMPEEGSGWIAYRLEKSEVEPDTTAEARKETEKPEEEPEEEKDEKKDQKDGTTLVVRNLETGAETTFDLVTDYVFSKDGSWLAFARSEKDGESDGVYVVRTGETAESALMSGDGDYKQLAMDEGSRQLAFVSNRNDYEADQPAFTLYHVRLGDENARPLATEGNEAFAEGWWISENGNVSFSDSGDRLFFGTAPRPEPEPEDDDVLDEEKVKVDVWSWRDPLLQPMQLLQAENEKKRSYRAVVHLDSGSIVQLASIEVPDVTVADEGDASAVLGTSNLPYRKEISWDSPRYYDGYLVDIETGERTLILEGVQDFLRLSPEGKYVFWWDRNELAWMTMSTSTREIVDVSSKVPFPVDYELHDWPYKPNSNGFAGWTEGDERFLINDTYDLWELDPDGEDDPVNVTDGLGRNENLRLRFMDLDREESSIDPDDDLLLSVLDRETMDGGFYRDRVEGNRVPEQLLQSNHSYGFSVRKAKDADVLLYTRSNFQEFPDLWTSDLDFGNARKMSNANPQQKDYLWGTAELVTWTSIDGEPLKGILYKPEGFDPARKYPMMVYFYEKMSTGLNSHVIPSAGSSSINRTFYVSRGYLVFIPDIPYKVGYPGESAMNAVMPGIASLIDEGFVDADHIGVQGHSWGGYQIAYMVTQTNLFAAAEAGAPVSNMTSAYGGIRWGSGMSRMFQYEMTQSRIGGTLWDATLRYIHNSPLFQAPKVETPLLMMHNDEDGAVPWYQGIEYFVALRRLNKPVWMLNYNGEAHGLRKNHNRKDWTIRLQQFFDHYLKNAPAPVWLMEGVPAVKKGLTLGLVESEECACGMQ